MDEERFHRIRGSLFIIVVVLLAFWTAAIFEDGDYVRTPVLGFLFLVLIALLFLWKHWFRIKEIWNEAKREQINRRM